MKQDLDFLEKKAKLTNVSKCFVVFVVIVKLENKHRLTFVDRSFTLCSPACNSLQYDFFRLPCLYIFLIITENHVCGKNNNSQTILLSLQNWQEGVAMVINTTQTQPVGRRQKHWRISNTSPLADDAWRSYLD